jgi:MFS family permease
MLAGTSFTFTLVGLTVHFIPILADDGETRMAAAGIASLIGIFSAVGRLAVGILLDWFGSARKVAAGCLLLPISGCVLLILQGGGWTHALAAMLVGLGLGSEFDLVTYLATRHLGMKRFGMLFGAIMVPMSLGTATGPLVASSIHDHFSSYGPFLWLAIPLLAIGALSLVLLGPYPDFVENEENF